MEKRKHIFWELTLLLGSVFVFRSLWIIMDRIDFFNSELNLWVFFVIGILMTSIGFYRVIHADRRMGKDRH